MQVELFSQSLSSQSSGFISQRWPSKPGGHTQLETHKHTMSIIRWWLSRSEHTLQLHNLKWTQPDESAAKLLNLYSSGFYFHWFWSLIKINALFYIRNFVLTWLFKVVLLLRHANPRWLFSSALKHMESSLWFMSSLSFLLGLSLMYTRMSFRVYEKTKSTHLERRKTMLKHRF